LPSLRVVHAMRAPPGFRCQVQPGGRGLLRSKGFVRFRRIGPFRKVAPHKRKQ